MMSKIFCVFVLSCIGFGLFGCSSNPYGDSYGVADTRTIQQVRYGTIMKTEPVTIEGEGQVVGAVAGAAIGGILGSKIGGGSGSDIAAIGGGVLGGVAGSKAAKGVTQRQGVNLTIKMDAGDTVAIVQEANPNMMFRVGQRVRVNIDGRTARVVPE
ncbi:glycine zipper 2TM domain-containing protein [Photobacterium sp. TY1-4]|uniref:glycine zipper 2TM domain-containing protein n=1 Tax=Photobacterium sp. TY1-4 TaxID=2899122 RepID=UPI0021C15976|nr:glycine zipper 2TM domain-containing protein [Photobacterium sp. TY1-4]UXI04155.1 glycine zipper 2TM domain-containing protein [Photobacterium sp. TY1-4]